MTQDNGRQALGEIMAAVEHALGGAAPVAVATVVDAGELGIEVGAKMLVRRDGTTVGSIDGAVVDAQVVTEAMAAFEQFPRAVLQSMYVGRAHEAVARRSQAQPGDARLMLEVFEAPARLVVVGGGHVGLQIANFGALLGFRITVIDDRPEFANPERFPMADEVLCKDIDTAIDEMRIDSTCSVVLVSRGHQQDTRALRHVAERGAGYVGMIGSRRRTTVVMQNLAQEGIAADALAHVHTPIGLDIGAETPEEIALSILAEIVLERHGGTGRKLSTLTSRRQADRG